jgi:hypothetical protein
VIEQYASALTAEEMDQLRVFCELVAAERAALMGANVTAQRLGAGCIGVSPVPGRKR